MAIIPTEIYNAVENMIRKRDSYFRDVQEALMKARAKAFDISAPSGAGGSGKYRSGKSRVERAAIQLAKVEEEYAAAIKWMDIFKQLDESFPQDTSVGFTVSLLYGNGMSQEDVCRFTGSNRQTVRRNRDKYIVFAALLAVQAGLIEIVNLGEIDIEETE